MGASLTSTGRHQRLLAATPASLPGRPRREERPRCRPERARLSAAQTALSALFPPPKTTALFSAVLDGVVSHISVPFLICHGENDRQIPLEYAHRSYEQATASPKRELRVFTADEGATEHIGLDHLPHVSTFIADWVADTFAERRAGHRS